MTERGQGHRTDGSPEHVSRVTDTGIIITTIIIIMANLKVQMAHHRRKNNAEMKAFLSVSLCVARSGV